MNVRITLSTLVLAGIVLACDNSEPQLQKQIPLDDSPVFVDLDQYSTKGRMGEVSSKYTVLMAEYITAEGSQQVGRTVFFNNVGNKQLTADFVPGLSLDGTDQVSYYVDQNRPSVDLPVATSSAAITRAMQTWDGVICSDLGMAQRPYDASVTTGFISGILGFGGSTDYIADVVHAGWLPASFFDFLAPQGSTFILGVTFTIIFTDETGAPSDVDSNGKADVAWREIYYNDRFTWRDGSTYDVETIALHEAGHGLSQGHFGKAFLDAGKGSLHFSPRAVMNAAYSGVQRQIMQTDNAGHCSIWSSWPSN